MKPEEKPQLTREQVFQVLWQTLPPEEQERLGLCMWATEVLRRKCPVYWL